METLLIVIFVGGILGVGAIVCSAGAKSEEKKLNDFLAENKIPSKHVTMIYDKKEYCAWKDEERVVFHTIPRKTMANSPVRDYNFYQKEVITANIKEIISFNIVGDAYTDVKGGGSSLGGAVAGAVVAGGAGAVIGSRKKVQSERVDKRNTLITIKKNGQIENIFLPPTAYEILLKLIPEKDINFVKSNVTEKETIVTKEAKNNDIPNQIRELSKLKDDGILTEEEFNNKKAMLLEKM